jgi:hypothetical protein
MLILKNYLLVAALFFVALGFRADAQNPLFNDQNVPSIFIELPADSFAYLLENLVNDRYLLARFVFDDGLVRDTVETAGLRLRGNTSLGAAKKSFKVSFNTFLDGGRYRGVKKINLIGSANDPTMIRQKLFYDVWNRAGLPKRRVSFAKLYVNGAYRGLYSNVEEIDKEWLERVFPEKDGNLYKCIWPADLVYLGNNQATYQAILNNPNDPASLAYALTTNETENDYSDLIGLMLQLNQPVNASFATNIQNVLNVDAYLKAFAVEVATGHWDDYAYNKNNYYLYHNLATDKFEFVSYDADNTFGIDWVNRDWAKRNCYAWHKGNEPRPLVTKLLAVPAFKQQYTRYLDTLARFIIHPDSIFPRIDFFHDLITPAAVADPYRPLDFGYTVEDFHNGFTQTIDDHTPYGIKPFLSLRRDSLLAQITGMLTVSTDAPPPSGDFSVFPNPFRDRFFVGFEPENHSEEVFFQIFDARGRLIEALRKDSGTSLLEWPLAGLSPGIYCLRVFSESGTRVVRLLCVGE